MSPSETVLLQYGAIGVMLLMTTSGLVWTAKQFLSFMAQQVANAEKERNAYFKALSVVTEGQREALDALAEGQLQAQHERRLHDERQSVRYEGITKALDGVVRHLEALRM